MMDWVKFIQYFEGRDDSPVLLPLLKKAILLDSTNNALTVACENLGAKLFLDGKKDYIEGFLSKFNKRETVIDFVVQKGKGKKKQISETTLPLMEFKQDKEKKVFQAGVQTRFSFENFAVSNSNHMAHAAAQAVSETPGQIYNPLFIYGDVGVGKTHLSNAIANTLIENDIGKRVLYCTSEEFTNDLVENIREKKTKDLRNKYRKLDLLIVDDVQFIAGKNYVQEEFYHTFNALVQSGSQIILTSDRPPKEIKALEDRLKSRFSGGLMLDMQKPDFELRTAILLIKAKERKIEIDIDAAKRIAEQITDSRELEGALLKLLSISLSQESNKITKETAVTELKRQEKSIVSKITPQDVIKTVSAYYGLKPSHIKSPSRKQNIALARQVIMYILRKSLGLNYEEIAFLLKRKDHTTILHGVDKIIQKTLKEEEFKNEVNNITRTLLST